MCHTSCVMIFHDIVKTAAYFSKKNFLRLRHLQVVHVKENEDVTEETAKCSSSLARSFMSSYFFPTNQKREVLSSHV